MSSRITIFDPATERLILWMGAVLAAGVAFLYLFGYLHSRGLDGTMLFVAGFLFFNFTHSALTFVFLLAFPEVRGWGRTRLSGMPISRGVAAVIGLAVIFLFGILSRSHAGAAWAKWGLALLFILRNMHTTAQFRGLSSLYNQEAKAALRLTAQELRKFAFHERIERRFFQALEILSAVAGSLLFRDFSRWQVGAVIALSLLVCVALWGNAWCFPGARRSNKPFFLIRVFFLPLNFAFFLPAYCALLAVHGVEYLAVYRKMKGNSSWAADGRFAAAVFWGAIAIAALVTLPLFHGDWFSGFGAPLIAALISVQFVLEFGHYYLDGLLFRFSRAEVREYILPLLRPGSSPLRSGYPLPKIEEG